MYHLAPLNAFIHAAEARSFTAAGRTMGISSSAVGKAVARLEERLGVQLLHRSTRNVTLTTEGAQFLKRCQTIFGEFEAAEQEIMQATTTPRGKLRMSLPLIGMLMMPTLAKFLHAHPAIELDLDFTDRLVDVIEEGFDAVIRTGKVSDSQLMMRKLGTYSYVIVGAPSYLDQRGVPETPEDLAKHSCLLHRWSTTGKFEKWRLSRDQEDIDIDPPVSVVATTMEPLIDMAERGLGLVYTPIFSVRKQLVEGSLRTVLDHYLRDIGTLQILWPSSRHRSPKLKTFVDFMAQNLLASTP